MLSSELRKKRSVESVPVKLPHDKRLEVMQDRAYEKFGGSWSMPEWSNGNLQGGPQRQKPLNFWCKLQKVLLNPFNLRRNRLEHTQSTQTTTSPEPNFLHYDQLQGYTWINEASVSRNSICSSCQGIRIPESPPVSSDDQTTIYGTSPAAQSSSIYYRDIQAEDSLFSEDFPGFYAPLNTDDPNIEIWQGFEFNQNHILHATPQTNNDNPGTSISGFGTRQIGNPDEWDSWIIRKERLHKIKTLESGSYGQVSLGMLDEIEVAYKEMFPPNPDHYVYPGCDENSYEIAQKRFEEDFNRESQILLQLSHPKIVRFFGADPQAKCIIIEYVRHGSVYNLLHRRGGNQNLKNLIRDNLGVRLDIVKQAALGLKYLHSKQILHLDFKTQNLLVGQEYYNIDIKVCDFGLSRVKVSRTCNSQGAIGTPEYMAPEVLRDAGEKSYKADIFSLGVVLYELVTLRRPWKGYEGWQVWYQVVEHNKRLQIPENIPERIKNLILECWLDKPNDRPSIDKIIGKLKELIEIYPSRNVFVDQTLSLEPSIDKE